MTNVLLPCSARIKLRGLSNALKERLGDLEKIASDKSAYLLKRSEILAKGAHASAKKNMTANSENTSVKTSEVSLKQREEALLAKESLLTNVEQAQGEAKPMQEIYDRLADKLQDDFNKMIQESRENIKADELARELKFNKNWSKAYNKIVSSQDRAYSDRMAKVNEQKKKWVKSSS